MYWDGVTFGLGGRHIYFRYNSTSGDIVDNAIEQSDLKNMGIIVGILFVGVKKNVLDRGNLRPHKHNVYVN